MISDQEVAGIAVGYFLYIALLADILERLRPDIAIGRIVSSVPPGFTDAPWGLLRPNELLGKLERCLEERQSFQGMRYRGNP